MGIVQDMKMKRGTQLQALGGYNDAHSLPAMMNALRLEMKDEGNVVMNSAIMKGASRPHIHNNALIQSYYVKTSEITDRKSGCQKPKKDNELFSFEKYRKRNMHALCTQLISQRQNSQLLQNRGETVTATHCCI